MDDKLSEIVIEAIRIKNEHLEMMAAAYLLKTQIDPREVELVEQHLGTKIVWYFRKREVVGGKEQTND
jgi:hypothetical protein